MFILQINKIYKECYLGTKRSQLLGSCAEWDAPNWCETAAGAILEIGQRVGVIPET